MLAESRQIMPLLRGPSREEMFDRLRLGREIKEPMMKFASQLSGMDVCLFEIEGLHVADKEGYDWFFWGKQFNMLTGEFVVFVFGRWNTKTRTGQHVCSHKSFFRNLMATE